MTLAAELQTIRERIEISDEVELLAHVARTDAVRLLDAVEKVLELHAPIPQVLGAPYCSECYDPDWIEPTDNDYPCETVRTITTALEGK